MRYLPIHFDLRNKTILVVGGGRAAEAKLRTLVKTVAHILVCAPEITPEIQAWVQSGCVELVDVEFDSIDLAGIALVYAAHEDVEKNRSIATWARKGKIPVNTADMKNVGSFISPAIIDRSPLLLSIGSEGHAPGLVRAIRTDLEARLPQTLGVLTLNIQKWRTRLADRLGGTRDRRKFWSRIFDTRCLSSLLGQTPEQFDKTVRACLDNQKTGRGRVVLAGAGPGDPDLLTARAIRHLHSADVIVYDRLVSQGVLGICRREAEYIYVGKTPGGPSTNQDRINAILVARARAGQTVIRLKSGDPLIFSRADEEIRALTDAGIDFEICPGITSATAAAAAIGVSLTTRGRNKAVSLLTGHDAKGFAEQDWVSLAQNNTRAVVYMGSGAARFIQGRLLLHGASSELPVTVVENASRETEIILESGLATLADDISRSGITGPAVLMIGYEAAPTAKPVFDTARVAV